MLLKSCIAGFSSLALATAAVVAPSDDRRPANARKGIKMDFEVLHGNSKQDASRHNKPKLSKREDNSTLYEITNVANYYQAVVQLGSNKDECKVLLDTGSSYLWVMEQNVACEAVYRRHDADEQPKKRDTSSFSDSLGFGANAGTIGAGTVNESGSSPANPTAGSEYLNSSSAYFPDTTSGASYNDTAGHIFGTDTAETYEYASLTTGFPDSSESGWGSGWWPDEDATTGGTCTALGSFNTAGSDTFRVNKTAADFDIQYEDDTSATGVWGSDTVGFGNEQIRLSFGVVSDSSSEQGVFGIGPYDEFDDFNSTSNNFPIQLKEQNIIDKVAYSLFLNKNSSSTGSVLFGAVDHKKYTGQLQTVPMVSLYPGSTIIDSFAVTLNGIRLESTKQNVTVLDEPIAAILDSGTTLAALPESLVRALVASFSADTTYTYLPQVDCAYKKTQGYIAFNFSGVVIKVPLGDFILEADGFCMLGVQEMDDMSGYMNEYPVAILGDTMLRNAYVVYDMEAEEISLAQANYTDDEDIEAITSTVPSAVKAPGYSATSISTDVSTGSGGKFDSLASRSYPSTILLALVLGMLYRITMF